MKFLPTMRHAARALALWLGLVALTVQGLAPLCLAMPQAAASGATSIVLCSLHGFQTVHLDADGNPLPAAPVQNNSTCPLCSGFHGLAGFTLPPPVALAQPFLTAAEAGVLAARVPHAKRLHVSYLGRAPPRERSIVL